MNKCRSVLLRFNSNAANYEVSVFDGEKLFVKRVFKSDGLRFFTASKKIAVTAKPLTGGFAGINRFILNVENKSVHYVNFCFYGVTVIRQPMQYFTLTDENYGLGVNGKLIFDGI